MVHGSDPTPHSFHVNQKQAVTSVLTFFVGGLLAQIRPRSWGPTHRGMLVVMTLIQSLLTVFAAICSRKSIKPIQHIKSN